MSYRDDQIKLLDLVCSHTLPIDFEDEKVQIIEVYEDQLKEEGFSYYGAMNIIKDFFPDVKQLDNIIATDGRRGIRIFAEGNLNNVLFNLKYPYYEVESWAEEEEYNSYFPKTPEKVSITIDSKKGIYQTNNIKKIYQIKIPSKKFLLIKHISSNDKVSLSEFVEELKQDKTVIMKAIKEINNDFMKKLSVSNPLIIRLDTSGYSINKDKFDIKIN